jgi:hypothetical protein
VNDLLPDQGESLARLPGCGLEVQSGNMPLCERTLANALCPYIHYIVCQAPQGLTTLWGDTRRIRWGEAKMAARMISGDESKMRASMDWHHLKNAAAIKADPERHKRAMAHGQKEVYEARRVMSRGQRLKEPEGISLLTKGYKPMGGL